MISPWNELKILISKLQTIFYTLPKFYVDLFYLSKPFPKKKKQRKHFNNLQPTEYALHNYFPIITSTQPVSTSVRRKDVCNVSACPATLQSMPCLRIVQASSELVIADMDVSRNGHTMSSNANYKQDTQYVFTPSRWILGSIGIWPIAFRGIGQHFSKIVIVICNFVLGFAIVPCVLHIIYDQKDLNIRLKLSGLLGFCSTATMKFFVLVIRRSKIQQCIEHVKDDWWQVGDIHA